MSTGKPPEESARELRESLQEYDSDPEQVVRKLQKLGYSEGVSRLAVEHAPYGGGKLTWHEVTVVLPGSRYQITERTDTIPAPGWTGPDPARPSWPGPRGHERMVPRDEFPPQVRGTFEDAILDAAHDVTATAAVSDLLAIIAAGDRWLDGEASPAYKASPLANHWRRVTKVGNEAGKVWEALSAWTDENPRKHQDQNQAERAAKLLEELGDVVMSGLMGIQHLTKDRDETWQVFIEAAEKVWSRTPEKYREEQS